MKENYRYERKFVITQFTREEIENMVKLHPAIFSEVYAPRFVNNIYFDSFNLENYFDNVDGASDRRKVRIRWYGDLFGIIEKPVLEFKIKRGLLGDKRLFDLNRLLMDENVRTDTLYALINRSNLPPIIKMEMIAIEPKLLNRYKRKYYQSSDMNYRITIDSEMDFYRINQHNNTFLNRFRNDSQIVLELKYDRDKDNSAESISNYFPFRTTKNSKYVNGIDWMYDE